MNTKLKSKTTDALAPKDDKDIIIQNQKVQILSLRKQLQNAEAKLIALGH